MVGKKNTEEREEKYAEGGKTKKITENVDKQREVNKTGTRNMSKHRGKDKDSPNKEENGRTRLERKQHQNGAESESAIKMNTTTKQAESSRPAKEELKQNPDKTNEEEEKETGKHIETRKVEQIVKNQGKMDGNKIEVGLKTQPQKGENNKSKGESEPEKLLSGSKNI